MSATLSVRGSAIAPAKPDDADLTLTLSALLPTPDEALSDVAERTGELKQILTACDIPDRDRITSGITVREQRDWENQQYVHRGYLARTTVVVRLTDPEVIGRLMKDAIGDVDAEVAGPHWRVANDNPAHTEARKLAIADARRRADAYVDALGVRLGAVAEVSEPGVTTRSSHLVMSDMAYSASRSEPELEIEAGDVDIQCSIDVVYRIEQ
jgi:uncharacterized protein YggE